MEITLILLTLTLLQYEMRCRMEKGEHELSPIRYSPFFVFLCFFVFLFFLFFCKPCFVSFPLSIITAVTESSLAFSRERHTHEAQWRRIVKNRDVSTGPLARLLPCSLICSYCSLICLHRSLVFLLRPACFARALRCAHSFACSLTDSLSNSWENE